MIYKFTWYDAVNVLLTWVYFQNFSFTGVISKLDLYDNINFKSKIYTYNGSQNMQISQKVHWLIQEVNTSEIISPHQGEIYSKKNWICSPLLINNTYTASVSFLTNDGRGNVPAHGKIFDNRGDVAGLGKNPQNGVALSNVTPFTRCGQDAAKYRATNPPREFPTM